MKISQLDLSITCHFPFQCVSLTIQAAGRQKFSTKTCQDILVNTEVCKITWMHSPRHTLKIKFIKVYFLIKCTVWWVLTDACFHETTKIRIGNIFIISESSLSPLCSQSPTLSLGPRQPLICFLTLWIHLDCSRTWYKWDQTVCTFCVSFLWFCTFLKFIPTMNY